MITFSRAFLFSFFKYTNTTILLQASVFCAHVWLHTRSLKEEIHCVCLNLERCSSDLHSNRSPNDELATFLPRILNRLMHLIFNKATIENFYSLEKCYFAMLQDLLLREKSAVDSLTILTFIFTLELRLGVTF